MLEEELKSQIAELEERIKKLEGLLAEHKHLGLDGSSVFDGETEFNGRSFIAYGINSPTPGTVTAPFVATDASKRDEKNARASSFGMAAAGAKETQTENLQAIIGTGKEISTARTPKPVNREDFSVFNVAQLSVSYYPQSPQLILAGPSVLPASGQVFALRTPAMLSFVSQGTITTGGNTLVDSGADYKPDQLVGSIVTLMDSSQFPLPGSLLESHRIIGNTRNTIFIGRLERDGQNVVPITTTWTQPSGTYAYQIFTPMQLGNASFPFTRLYVGDDIRLGYGASDGSQVRYIKWGFGNPENLIKANVGSLYLRLDGTPGNTLYVKEAGTGRTGWKRVVTTTA